MDDDAVLARFGRNLAVARQRAEVRQEDLAASVGCDPSYISLLERGKRNPSLTTLEKLASALGTTVRSLVD